jgi:hypothetical protein
MTANPYRPAEPRKNVKDLIEEMRAEVLEEKQVKVNKPLPKKPKTPKIAKKPSHPHTKRPTNTKRKAQKFIKKKKAGN